MGRTSEFLVTLVVCTLCTIQCTLGGLLLPTCPKDSVFVDTDALTVEEARDILMSDDPRLEGFHPSGSSPAPTLAELAIGQRPDVTPRAGVGVYQFGSDGLNLTDFNVRRITCRRRNLTDITEYTVLTVNGSSLLNRLGDKNGTSGRCVVVLFYAPWCPFCAKVAPQYNAIARAFYQLDVLAIDAVHFSNLNSRFGTIAVPNIVVFHNAKAVARFNSTERTFTAIRDFIGNVTGIRPNRTVDVEDGDYEGPLKNDPTESMDYYLLLSWLFIVSFSGFQFSKSSLGQRVLQSLNTFGHLEPARDL